jgi:hypothetical protein
MGGAFVQIVDGRCRRFASASQSLEELQQRWKIAGGLILDEAAALSVSCARRILKASQDSAGRNHRLARRCHTDWAAAVPDCTPLESWVDGQSPSSYPHELLSVAAPILPPKGDSRPWGATLLEW